MEWIKKRKRDLILLLVLLLILAVSGIVLLRRHWHENAEDGCTVVVRSLDAVILEVPLSENGRYIIENGSAEKAAADLTLEKLGEEASPSKNEINILEVQDGAVRVFESNCQNQVCVQSGSLTEDAHDFPIVCLPHGLIVTIEESDRTR